VLGIRHVAHFMSFCIVLEYLHLRPLKGSKFVIELVLICIFTMVLLVLLTVPFIFNILTVAMKKLHARGFWKKRAY